MKRRSFFATFTALLAAPFAPKAVATVKPTFHGVRIVTSRLIPPGSIFLSTKPGPDWMKEYLHGEWGNHETHIRAHQGLVQSHAIRGLR